MNFIEQCLDGLTLPDQIDNFVDKWHSDDNIECELNEYLGMSDEEYEVWAHNSNSIYAIIAAHKTGSKLEYLLNAPAQKMAARSDDKESFEYLHKWIAENK